MNAALAVLRKALKTCQLMERALSLCVCCKHSEHARSLEKHCGTEFTPYDTYPSGFCGSKVDQNF